MNAKGMVTQELVKEQAQHLLFSPFTMFQVFYWKMLG